MARCSTGPYFSTPPTPERATMDALHLLLHDAIDYAGLCPPARA
jgi:hypothetical protein